jgi:hypothetical protein
VTPTRWLIAALAVAAIAAGVALASTGGGDDEDGRSASARSPSGGGRGLAGAGCPEPKRLELEGIRRQKVERAKRGVYSVFHTPTRLDPPVDWAQDPLGAHRFRQNLHKLRYLTPLLSAYELDGDTAALRQAIELALDWVRANPLGGENVPIEAWTDKVVGDRVPILGFTTRAAACEDLLDREGGRDLLGSLRDHGRFLADAENYVPDNHGLYADAGLFLLSDYLPFLDRAPEWRELAVDRFEQTLTDTLAEGIWLEHSTAYEFFVLDVVEDFAALADDRRLDALVRRMRAAAAWLVMPDGEMTQFGSSNLEPVPRWALERAGELEGMRVFDDAGFAIVRSRGDGGVGYLAVGAGFHNLVHKQADDLGFELYDRDRRLVTDTGLYHKDPGPERDFVLSAAAHSVLAVDGQTFPVADEANAYGSGIVAGGEGGGWFAIAGRNPLVESQGVRHKRLFLYRPGAALVVVDRVKADGPHTYSRYFQLGPDVEIEPRGARAVALRAGGLDGRLVDAAAGVPLTRSEVRARDDPLAGWTSPDFRELVPRWTIQLDSEADDVTHAATIALEPGAPIARSARWRRGTVSVRLQGGGTIHVRFADGSLEVDEAGSG